MARVVGVGALVMLVLMVGAEGGLGLAPAAAMGRQDAEAVPAEIGAGPVEQQALGLIGKSEYRESSVKLYGYLNAVLGLERALLFGAAEATTEATARFTYSGEAAIIERVENEGLSLVSARGTMVFYFDEEAGASFDQPESFASGLPIAIAEIGLRDTLDLRNPDARVGVGEGELTQTSAEPFSLEGERYRFGHVGLQGRLVFAGADTRGEAESPPTVMSVAGAAFVTRRAAQPPVAERPAATAAATEGAEQDGTTPVGAATETAAAIDCGEIEGWLAEAIVRSERAAELGQVVSEDATVGAEDADTLREAASEAAELFAEQRAAEVPEAGEATNRLLVTAYNTIARGLGLLATATDEGDEAAFAQGRQILRSGDELALRAGEELGQLEGECRL